MTEELKKQEIKIEIDDQTANGAYSNSALITHSETEFIIDFIFVQPQNAKAKVRSRVVLSPLHAKKLSEALKENIAKHEIKFGQIKSQNASHGKSEFYN